VSNSDDTQLAAQVAQGDERAFLQLYDRYASHVYALTMRILRDANLAEEATQDAFLKLWSRARLFLSERGSLLTWLLTIARRTALDRLRLEGRRPTLSTAVQSLSPEHRQLLELAYYQGLTHTEIAETLNWPLGTVKTRLRAAMEQLRREWGEL
jgi:RNA polymerase sigma-70 factor (ECF subfamily)